MGFSFGKDYTLIGSVALVVRLGHCEVFICRLLLLFGLLHRLIRFLFLFGLEV